MEYLREIRDIRDNNPRLFEKIKKLPLKARSSYVNPENPDELLIFFREGSLKKFIACGKEARELTFLEAAPLMRAAPGTKRGHLPSNYYSRLQTAKNFLEGEIKAQETAARPSPQNIHLLETISYLQTRDFLTEDDQDYLALLSMAISQSALAKKAIKRLASVVNGHQGDDVQLFNILQNTLPPKDLSGLRDGDEKKSPKDQRPKQIVLSQYLAPANGEIA